MTSARLSLPRWRWLKPIVFVPILALLALSAWAFASPVGASPDDDFHLASIWCGAGERAPLCTAGDHADERKVPEDFRNHAICYVRHPTESAACQGRSFGTQPNNVVSTSRGNFDGLYPPVFYFTLSAFAGPNIQISVLAMRIFNSALFVSLVTLLTLLLPRRLRAALVGSVAISLVPLGMFLIPSTNPSSWGLLSATLVFPSVLGFFETAGKRRIGLAVLAIVGTVVGAGARADSAAFACLAIVCAGIIAFQKDRQFLISAILPLILIVISVLLYLSVGQSQASSSGLSANHVVAPFNIGHIITNFLNVPSLWVGVFGSWALGWLDTGLPAIVWVAGLLAFVTVVVAGLHAHSRRKTVVVVLMAVALWAVPLELLAASDSAVGMEVQPRYLLPLIVILAAAALVQSKNGQLRIPRAQLWITAAAITAANSIALYKNMDRYVEGVGGKGIHTWWWDVPFSPTTNWLIGSLASAGMLVLLARHFSSTIGPHSHTAESVPVTR